MRTSSSLTVGSASWPPPPAPGVVAAAGAAAAAAVAVAPAAPARVAGLVVVGLVLVVLVVLVLRSGSAAGCPAAAGLRPARLWPPWCWPPWPVLVSGCRSGCRRPAGCAAGCSVRLPPLSERRGSGWADCSGWAASSCGGSAVALACDRARSAGVADAKAAGFESAPFGGRAAGAGGLDGRDEVALLLLGGVDAEPARELLQLRQQHRRQRALLGRRAAARTAGSPRVGRSGRLGDRQGLLCCVGHVDRILPRGSAHRCWCRTTGYAGSGRERPDPGSPAKCREAVMESAPAPGPRSNDSDRAGACRERQGSPALADGMSLDAHFKSSNTGLSRRVPVAER